MVCGRGRFETAHLRARQKINTRPQDEAAHRTVIGEVKRRSDTHVRGACDASLSLRDCVMEPIKRLGAVSFVYDGTGLLVATYS